MESQSVASKCSATVAHVVENDNGAASNSPVHAGSRGADEEDFNNVVTEGAAVVEGEVPFSLASKDVFNLKTAWRLMRRFSYRRGRNSLRRFLYANLVEMITRCLVMHISLT